MPISRHHGFRRDLLPRLAEHLEHADEFVYCCWPQGDRTVKIGKSRAHPHLRIATLATACARELKLVAYTCAYTEREMHRKLHRYRVRGEHFRLTAEVVREVAAWTWVDAAVLAELRGLSCEVHS